jgi:hypothetical protein
MLFFETAFLLLYFCKQHVLLWQQQIFRTSNLVCSKQLQLELVNSKLKISSLSTLLLIEQYIFLLSHSKIYSEKWVISHKLYDVMHIADCTFDPETTPKSENRVESLCYTINFRQH